MHGWNESWLTVADDIVTRLRGEAVSQTKPHNPCRCGICGSIIDASGEAANEIEELRKDRALQARAIGRRTDEIERLRNDLEEAKNEYQKLWDRHNNG